MHEDWKELVMTMAMVQLDEIGAFSVNGRKLAAAINKVKHMEKERNDSLVPEDENGMS